MEPIADLRLTIYLPDGAVAGRVERITDTGMIARVEALVPRDLRLRFVLHLQDGVVAGEAASLGQVDRSCRLQFCALSERDRARLEPWTDPYG